MIWNAPGALIEDNDIRFGRDGIFTRVSKRDVFRGNRFEKTRFAIHYMYTNDSVIEDNVSIDNTVGYAIMFSDRLKIVGNVSDGDRDHGLMLNSSNRSEIRATASPAASSPPPAGSPSRRAPTTTWRPHPTRPSTRAATASARRSASSSSTPTRTIIEDNRFEGCGIGIHFTAGAEGNAVAGNAFIGNQTQVKYVGTRLLDWSEDGPRQLLVRQPRLRPRRRRHRRRRLPPERHHRPGDVDRPAGAPPGDEPRRAGDPLGAVPLPRARSPAASSTARR